MKRAVWVVNIGNYLPDVSVLTLPTIRAYAARIKADFNLITKQAWPNAPVSYEKMQVHHLGQSYEHNILVDLDIAISRDMPDVANIVPVNHVGVHMSYNAPAHFPCDQYFARDGRKISIALDFVATNEMMHDLWTPLERPPEEVAAKLVRPFQVDEYCTARNMARFGLRFSGHIPDEGLIYHLNASSDPKRMGDLKKFVAERC